MIEELTKIAFMTLCISSWMAAVSLITWLFLKAV